MSSLPGGQLCRRFSLDEVQSATQNFDEALVIGQGGFGKVYKGNIGVENGVSIIVAIKRLDSGSNQGAPEFWAEIEMLSKLRHCNLVSLIGYCNDSSEMILVYEFMPHGTLDDHLHKFGTNLSWVQRLKISIGAARGLHYLHTGTGTKQGVIHRDVKSSNFLLDEDYAAKISDFGLSKIGPTNQSATYVNTLIKGTFGYLDPEYFLTGRLTRKSDVFAFGVVLFELLCGRPAVDTSLDEEQCSLANWAHECIEEGKLDKIVDSNIKGKIFPKCLKVFAQIADRCLHSRSKERPTMAEVAVALELSLSLQEKFDNYEQPGGIWEFRRKMKGFFTSAKVNSGPGDTKPSRNNEDTIKYSPLSKEDRGNHDKVQPVGEILAGSNHTKAQREATPSDRDNIYHASLSKEDSGDSKEAPPDGKIQVLTHDLKMFSIGELKSATMNFAREMRLGVGEFGEVFRGYLNEKTYSLSESAIAVKRIYHYKIQRGLKEKSVDLNMLKEFSHPNLVKLLGYCFEDQMLFLVYEFMENGSLDSHLFTKDKIPLLWKTRIKIAAGVCQGLAFLHKTQYSVDNHQLRLHNILLDRDFNAKLSDFDVAKLVHGDLFKEKNIDPLYFYPQATNILEAKGHVRSFGVVLIQVLTGLPIISKRNLSEIRNTMNLKGELQKDRFRKDLDPRLLNSDDATVKYALKVASLAFICLDDPHFTATQASDVLERLYADMMKVL